MIFLADRKQINNKRNPGLFAGENATCPGLLCFYAGKSKGYRELFYSNAEVNQTMDGKKKYLLLQ